MSDDRPQDPQNPWSTPAPGGDTGAGAGADRTAPLPYGQGSAPPPPPLYGQPPATGSTPYGQPPTYGQPPAYGQQYGAPVHQGYAPDAEAAQVRSSATLWLILNIVSVLFCGNLPGIAGAIFAGLALGRVDADPADARRKTRIAKILFFAGLIIAAVLIVIAVIAFVVIGTSSRSSGSVTGV